MLAAATDAGMDTSGGAAAAPAVPTLSRGASVINLPWVEKYRPTCLKELVSHTDIIATIQRFINEDRLPHLLFYGPPGTGKTSLIKACAGLLYGPKYRSMVLELNASDSRGINVVREEIKTFASTRTVFNKGFKLIILDEADNMTNDSQNALRRIIEKYTKNTRFCLICNYVSKITPAVQSRCTRFRFAPLSQDQMTEQILRVAKAEGLTVPDEGMKALVTLARGDMRKALNILQCTSMAFPDITGDNVYTCTGQPLPEDIESAVQWMLQLSIKDVFRELSQLKTLKGLALADIIRDVHAFIYELDLPVQPRIYLLEKLALIEQRLAVGTSEEVQLGSLIAAFARVRVMCEASAEASKGTDTEMAS